MASLFSTISTPFSTITKFFQHDAKLVSPRSAALMINSNALKRRHFQPVASSKSTGQIAAPRRSGNYPPTIWHDNYLQSITSVYTEETHKRRAEELKEEVRLMLAAKKEMDRTSDKLKLIDELERLGLSYHFEDEIEKTLTNIFNNHGSKEGGDLFTTSLQFRLLRQHGFRVPQEVFSEFIDETGKLKSFLLNDTKGLLSLYEASYLSVEGESILDDARDFAAKHLAENLNNMDKSLAIMVMVRHALEIPLQWRMPRQETRWFIEVYASSPDMNPILLEFAKLDFNLVQAVHQSDLKASSRWWSNTGFGKHLSFGRDRVVENFMWAVGEVFEPQHSYGRIMSTKVNSLLTTIDDIYDVYGTLDELVLFTDAIERWDINSIEQLPNYMKICLFGLFNSVNEMAFDVLKEQDLHIISNLKKTWADACKGDLMEARWYYSGYTPTLNEYLENGWMSIATPVMLVHLYYFTAKPITKDAMKYLEVYLSVIRSSCIIVRLVDDLGTSSHEIQRGDVPKSIQCYMNDTGASEEEAREYIRNLISEEWKKLNENLLNDSPLPQSYNKIALNLAKVATWMYQYGDSHGVTPHGNKDRLLGLIIEPIHL